MRSYQIYTQAGLKDAYFEVNGAFPERTSKHDVVDYVWYKEIVPVAAEVTEDVDGLSDHRPLIVNFQL